MILSKSSVLVGGFFLTVALAIWVSYDRYVIQENYLVQTRVECDPTLNRCFAGVCDPDIGEMCEAAETEGESFYYAIALRNARSLRECKLNTPGCASRPCQENEAAACEMHFCTDTDVEAGVECTSPETFVADQGDETSERDSASGVDAIEATDSTMDQTLDQ